jgi:lactate dehydrogenase-like 2-hydroxyacid dehydrogenase
MSDESRWGILVACALPDEVNRDVAAHFDAAFENFERVPDAAPRLYRALGGREALLVTMNVPLDARAIAGLPDSLRAIASYSVGYEHIDVAAARQRGIAVFNSPGVLTDATAEVGMLLMLGAARRATESIALIRERRWTGWTAQQLNGIELAGKTLAIFGMGRIGKAVAARARAFGMTIHYCNRRRLPEAEERGAVFHADAARLLAAADVLLLASPSTAETRFWLDAQRIGQLKPGAIVVNVARGNLVVDEALIAALRDGRVRAAGLDVFNNEPALDPRYFDLPNVFMLPHIGSSTIETRRRMGRILIDGILAWRRGETPVNRLV